MYPDKWRIQSNTPFLTELSSDSHELPLNGLFIISLFYVSEKNLKIREKSLFLFNDILTKVTIC